MDTNRDRQIAERIAAGWACSGAEAYNCNASRICARCRSLAKEIAHALAEARAEAFKAGYHCRWHREQGSYCFDPAMSPGDPEGAFAAWQEHVSRSPSLDCASATGSPRKPPTKGSQR